MEVECHIKILEVRAAGANSSVDQYSKRTCAMKQAKVPHVMVTPDQQLNLLRAKARTGDRRVRAAEQKTRLAKTKLKSARRAYKLAKKSL